MIGVIGYCTPTGIGIMLHELREHLGIHRQLIIPNDPSLLIVSKWAENQWLSQNWSPSREELLWWVKDEKIDTVISVESSFGEYTFKWLRETGVRVILIPMWEFFAPTPSLREVDLYICPSYKCYQVVPFDNKVHVPWPVSPEAFPFRHREGPANVFVHNAGTGGMNGRKGTLETIKAFLKADIQGELIINSIRPLRDIGIEDGIATDPRISVREGPVLNNADLYSEGDVLIYCSHYDGHNLVALEGMCSGMPVITTDAEPMNELVPADDPLLVRVSHRTMAAGTLNPHCEVNHIDVDDLAQKIRYCTENDMAEISARNREIVENDYSWDLLKDRWQGAIDSVRPGTVPV